MAKKKQLTFSIADELDIRIKPGTPWISLKGGEDVKEFEVSRTHAMFDKNGSNIGKVEHVGLALVRKGPIIDKQYLTGDVNCTYKFTKRGKKYVINGIESIKQEVVLLDQENIRIVNKPEFSDLRILSLTKDGAPQSVINVKIPIDKSDPYRIHFTPIYHPYW